MFVSPVKAVTYAEMPPYDYKHTFTGGMGEAQAIGELDTGKMMIHVFFSASDVDSPQSTSADVKMWKRMWLPSTTVYLDCPWKVKGYFQNYWASIPVVLFVFIQKSLNADPIFQGELWSLDYETWGSHYYPVDTHDTEHFAVDISEAGDYNVGVALTGGVIGLSGTVDLWTEDRGAWAGMRVMRPTLYISASTGGTTSPAPGTHAYDYGSSVTVWASAYSGYYFNHWRLDGVKKYGSSITVTMNTDHTLKACFNYAGGCPMLSVYDGSDYVEEGLLDIHNLEGIDVVYEHTLASTPQRVEGAYLLRLTEHPKTHSYIDQVKLYAVLEDGTMKELPLIWAWHSEDGNVLPTLLHSDDWKADTLGADLNEGTSQSIDLKFAALSPNLEIAGFVFQIEGNNAIIK